MRRIAVIGSGIAGLSTAWHLSEPGSDCRVTLFEANDYVGGHTHTVDVSLPNLRGEIVTQGVDTGFLVFNRRTYPELLKLFAAIDVEVAASEMSFSVQAESGGLEWSGCSLDTVFAQRRNLLRPRFIGMLAEVLRFNRLCTALAQSADEEALAQSIGDFLDEHRFGQAFRRWYFLPMIGCIWSCPTEQMLAFPVATLIRFCHNHGLLQVTDRPQWYTVVGGARNYVQRMLARIPDLRLSTPVIGVRRSGLAAGVQVISAAGNEHFDEVVFACHSDQTLRILGVDASQAERAVLGAITYQPNRAVLHTDASLLPKRQKAWAAWNYEHAPDAGTESSAVCLHYLLNRLQPLPFAQPVVVSLNPVREPRADQVLASFDYAHPVFDLGAIAAQRRVGELQGRQHSWFCGAWTGYGFHEDGLKSGLAVVAGLRERWASAPDRLAA
jgi:predicted NAD/FAD-binding protein